MFAIIRTRWQTRPLSRRAKRRNSTAPGSLRKKYAGIVHPPNMVHSPINYTTSGDHRKTVLENGPAAPEPPHGSSPWAEGPRRCAWLHHGPGLHQTLRLQESRRDVPRPVAGSPRIIPGNVTVTIDNRGSACPGIALVLLR